MVHWLNISDPYLAEWKYEKLKEQIQEFEAKLDSSQEIAICLTSLGASIKLAVHDISFQNPDMLYFYGKVDGNEAQLIQHISQLNLLLIAVPRPDLTVPRRRIGFISASE